VRVESKRKTQLKTIYNQAFNTFGDAPSDAPGLQRKNEQLFKVP